MESTNKKTDKSKQEKAAELSYFSSLVSFHIPSFGSLFSYFSSTETNNTNVESGGSTKQETGEGVNTNKSSGNEKTLSEPKKEEPKKDDTAQLEKDKKAYEENLKKLQNWAKELENYAETKSLAAAKKRVGGTIKNYENSLSAKLFESKQALSDGQRKNILVAGLADAEEYFELAKGEHDEVVRLEKERLRQEEEVRKREASRLQKEEQLRLKIEAEKRQLEWEKEVDEHFKQVMDCRNIGSTPGPFKELWTALNGSQGVEKILVEYQRRVEHLKTTIKAIDEFKKREPQTDLLVKSKQEIEAFVIECQNWAQTIDGGWLLRVDQAVVILDGLIVGKYKSELGTNPPLYLVKEACSHSTICIPTTKRYTSLVIEAYEAKHADTKPQKLLAEERAKSNSKDHWLRVGTWLRALGFGGSPRTGPNGPVFTFQCGMIFGSPCHFTLFMCNVSAPVNGVAASVEEVMDVILPNAVGAIGPHITVEFSEDFGSPNNARLFKGNHRFVPGNVENERTEELFQAMRQRLQEEVNRIRTLIMQILEHEK